MPRCLKVIGVAAAAGVLALAAVAAPAAAEPAWPASAAARALAAEIRVMRGDLRRLRDDAALTAAQAEGLRLRLAGALAALPWLRREAGHPPEREAVAALRRALAEDDRAALGAGLDTLAARHPLDLTGILPPDDRPEALALAAALHEAYCAGCHAAGAAAADVPLPARDLFAEAAEQPTEEFAARMLNGIRGDHVTALENPFAAGDLSALIAFYRRGPRGEPSRR